MSGMGASQVNRKVDPGMQTAIQNYLENGGSVTAYPPNKHGECSRRRGIQYGNGGTPK